MSFLRVGGGGTQFRGARAVRSSNLSIASGAAIPFEVTRFDTDGFWNIAAPSRITIPAGLGGKYLVGCGTDMAGAAAGSGQLLIRRSGDIDFAFGGQLTVIATLAPVLSVAGVIDAVAGQFFDVQVFWTVSPQTLSGGDLTFLHAIFLGA